MIDQKVLDKIAALLNMTEENGCSVAESAGAAKQAQLLMSKHRLEMADISSSEEGGVEYSEDPLFQGKRKITWKNRLAMVIAEVNGCQAITYRMVQGVALRLVGSQSDIEIVRYLFSHIEREVERLVAEERKPKVIDIDDGIVGEVALRGKTAMNSFRLGVVKTIGDRLHEARKEIREEAQHSTALVKLDQREAEVASWIEDNLKLTKTSVKQRINDLAFERGKEAGRSISLNKGISGSGQKTFSD